MKATVRSAGDALSLELPKGLSAFFKPGAELTWVPFGPDGGVALRTERAEYFAGALTTFGIADVFGALLSGVRTGRLVVASGALRKTVTFRDGQATFATSTEAHERLGATLRRLNLVTPSQLQSALAQVRPGVKLGQVLTQEGVLTAANLYGAMALLVREIVLSLAAQDEGDFLFLEGPVASDDVIKLPERTRDLLLEGLKRADVVARLRKQLPAALRLAQAQPPGAADDQALWARCGSGADVASLREAYDGSEHDFLSALDALVRGGALAEGKKQTLATPSAPRPVKESALERYAAFVQALCQAFRQAGKDLVDLRSFFEDPLPGMEAAFDGVELSDDGRLDVERVFQNAAHDDQPLSRAKAYEALDAFVSYALFSAKNVLPHELADSLSREYRRIQEGLET